MPKELWSMLMGVHRMVLTDEETQANPEQVARPRCVHCGRRGVSPYWTAMKPCAWFRPLERQLLHHSIRR